VEVREPTCRPGTGIRQEPFSSPATFEELEAVASEGYVRLRHNAMTARDCRFGLERDASCRAAPAVIWAARGFVDRFALSALVVRILPESPLSHSSGVDSINMELYSSLHGYR
jgi:hypothetical protein